MYQESLTRGLFDIHSTSFLHAPYKLFPSIKNILGARSFFFFHFHRTLFVGLRKPA